MYLFQYSLFCIWTNLFWDAYRCLLQCAWSCDFSRICHSSGNKTNFYNILLCRKHSVSEYKNSEMALELFHAFVLLQRKGGNANFDFPLKHWKLNFSILSNVITVPNKLCKRMSLLFDSTSCRFKAKFCQFPYLRYLCKFYNYLLTIFFLVCVDIGSIVLWILQYFVIFVVLKHLFSEG